MRSALFATLLLALTATASAQVIVSDSFTGSNGTFLTTHTPDIDQTSSTWSTHVLAPRWGQAGDIPVPGDYDGDGKTDPAVFRPCSGTAGCGWYIQLSSTNYATSMTFNWGLGTDIPVPGDYDGDGKTDIAVFRPCSGTQGCGWYVLTSSTGYSNDRLFLSMDSSLYMLLALSTWQYRTLWSGSDYFRREWRCGRRTRAVQYEFGNRRRRSARTDAVLESTGCRAWGLGAVGYE